MKIKWKLKSLALGSLIAALYAILTIVFAPISYGPVQFRVAEALTLLPFYFPEAIPGLFVGCFIANFFGNGMLDVFAGSLATLAAAYLSRKMPRLWLAVLPPILVNMAVIGALLHYLLDVPLWSTAFYVGLGQAGACCLLGFPLMKALENRGILRRRQKDKK
ncbi:MAG: QueT transporter family protein [Synergistaceae bacterium]|nr:QueT transporter family protein [Synergistaceae bacterium]